MPRVPDAIKISSDILRDFFCIHTPLKDYNNRTWSLNQQGSIGATIDEKQHTYTLWHFPLNAKDTNKLVDLYFSFNIKLDEFNEIKEVNIKIFKEDKTIFSDSNNLIPTELLLRVEWSNEKQKENTTRVHAQPHWHIHSYKLVDILKELPSQEKDIIQEYIKSTITPTKITSKIMENPTPEDVDIKKTNHLPSNLYEIQLFRFHLAMLAEWDKPTPSRHNKQLTSEALKTWLPQCLNYIKDQFEYVLEKTG